MDKNIERAIYFSLGIAAMPAAAYIFSQNLIIKKCRIDTGKSSKFLRLLLAADLHASYYGKEQRSIIRKINDIAPDAVFFAGDIFDELRSEKAALLLLEAVAHRYPCFYVTGNHEYRINDVCGIKRRTEECGVKVLENEYVSLDIGGEKIGICGIEDPKYFGSRTIGDKWINTLNALNDKRDKTKLNILLSHRPEGAAYYKKTDFDVFMCGHAHGGQVIIPNRINGIYAPDQGVFPRYAGGMYVFKNNTMIVSRGLCKNLKPRIFNRPELVLAEVR